LVSRGTAGNSEFEYLNTGTQRVSSFIFSGAFPIDKEIKFASKAAYISTLIKFSQTGIEKFNHPAILKD
jgi:hypothetical protein